MFYKPPEVLDIDPSRGRGCFSVYFIRYKKCIALIEVKKMDDPVSRLARLDPGPKHFHVRPRVPSTLHLPPSPRVAHARTCVPTAIVLRVEPKKIHILFYPTMVVLFASYKDRTTGPTKHALSGNPREWASIHSICWSGEGEAEE